MNFVMLMTKMLDHNGAVTAELPTDIHQPSGNCQYKPAVIRYKIKPNFIVSVTEVRVTLLSS